MVFTFGLFSGFNHCDFNLQLCLPHWLEDLDLEPVKKNPLAQAGIIYLEEF